jgi:hypothetical protein
VRFTRPTALLLTAALLAAPAGALAAKDDKDLTAAEYEAKQIAEGKAKDGALLAPAPPPEGGQTAAPVTPLPPGAGGEVMPAPTAAPVTLDTAGIIVAIAFIIVGALAFADARRMSV